MILEKTIADPNDILPASFLSTIKDLEEGNTLKLSLLTAMIKELQDEDDRLFALNYLHEKTALASALLVQIYGSFVTDQVAAIRWHCAIYLGVYGTKENIPTLQPLLTDEHELVRAATLWSLAKLDGNQLFSEQIISELLQAYEDDRSRTLLAAALFLTNNNPDSHEMQTLKQYFLDHYYNHEADEYYSDALLGTYGQSAELLADILWAASIKIITSSALYKLDLQWLIENK